MVTIPNHSQAQRISLDIRRLAANQLVSLDRWHGNSYWMRVEIDPGSKALQYFHWSTKICEIEQAPETTDKVALTYFDARYHSATTRGFQSRLIQGMRGEVPANQFIRITNEMKLPMHQRSVLTWES